MDDKDEKEMEDGVARVGGIFLAPLIRVRVCV